MLTCISYCDQNSGNISNFLVFDTPICVCVYTYVYIYIFKFKFNPSSKLIVLTIRHRYLTKTVLLKALSKRKMATTALCSKQGVEGAVSFRLVGRLNDLFTSPSSVPTFSAFLSWSCDRRHERDEGEEPWWPSLSTVLHPAGPAFQGCSHLLKLQPNEW